VFEAFADTVGAVPASFPYGLLVAGFVGLVVLAKGVAAVPARRARRVASALLLNPE
jgi:hypothetical protein